MTYYIKTILLFIILLAGVNASFGQDIKAYSADKLMNRLAAGGDTLFVVNFWATWCGPCIQELPEFTKLADNYKGKQVKILLVSLDDKKSYPEKLAKFVSKKKLAHEVFWLSETNANEFIPKINNEWQGSIPATMLYYKTKNYTKLFEGMVKSGQLSVLIDKQLAVY